MAGKRADGVATEKARGVFERPPGSGVWWILYYDGNKRHREKVGSYKQACKAYEFRKAQQRLEVFEPKSIGRQGKSELLLPEAFERFLEEAENAGGISASHLRDQRAYAKVWVELLPGRSIVDVDAPALGTAVQALRKRTVAATKCAACRSPFRQEVERRLREGESCRSIAKWLTAAGDIGNHTGLAKHRKEHMGTEATAARRLSTASVNRYLACLQALFTWGMTHGHCTTNPVSIWKKTQKRGSLAENNQRNRILLPAELAAITRHLPERYHSALFIALGTGLRLSEQLSLRWKDIHFDTGFIHVGENRTRKQETGRKTKSGKDRKVPLLPDVADLFQALPSRGRSEWVFPAIRGDGPMGRHGGIRQAFDKALEASGVEDFTWHDCRHTFASNLAMAGVPLYDIQTILGHGSSAMTQRYSHLSPEHLAEAINGASERFAELTATCTATDKSANTETVAL